MSAVKCIDHRAAKKKADELLETVGLSDVCDKK
jgi:ABC-type polar amino acid transport system ATPase subunit